MLPFDIEIDDLEKEKQVVEEDILFYTATGDLERVSDLEREWQALDNELNFMRHRTCNPQGSVIE